MLAYLTDFVEFCTVQGSVEDMRKRIFCVTATLFMALLTVDAQSVADAFVSMPMDKTPYLTKEMKEKLVDGYKPGTVFSVTNRLQGETTVDTLSADYGRFLLSDAKELDIARLPVNGGDSILLCVETYKAPAPQSTMSFYDLHWNELPAQNLLPDMTDSAPPVPADSVRTEYSEHAVFSFELQSCVYDPVSKSLSVEMTTPFVPVEEKDKIKQPVCKRTLIWNGFGFKKG